MYLLWIQIKYWLDCLGYKLKPYDMLLDKRRWAFIPMTCCKCGRPAWRFTHPRVHA